MGGLPFTLLVKIDCIVVRRFFIHYQVRIRVIITHHETRPEQCDTEGYRPKAAHR